MILMGVFVMRLLVLFLSLHGLWLSVFDFKALPRRPIQLFESLSGRHPAHISLCSISYNSRGKRIEIVQRIFLDDLELALRRVGGDERLDIMQPADEQAFGALLKAYYLERVALWADKKKMTLRYLGYARHEEGMRIYLESESPLMKPPTALRIQNTILHEAYQDQKNMIKVRILDWEDSLILMPKNPMGLIQRTKN